MRNWHIQSRAETGAEVALPLSSPSTPALQRPDALINICRGPQPRAGAFGECQGSTLREGPIWLASLAQLERQEGGVATLLASPHVWTLVMAGRFEWLSLSSLLSPISPRCQLWPFNKISLMLVPSLWDLEIEICRSPQTQ